MESLKNNKNVATSDLSESTGSPRWEWVERTFDSREVADHAFVSWIMQHVRMSPFTLKLNLRDGEVVRTTSEHGGGMKIEIRFDNTNVRCGD